MFHGHGRVVFGKYGILAGSSRVGVYAAVFRNLEDSDTMYIYD